MEYSTILLTIYQTIAVITINRPDKLNAINATVMDEISMAIDEVYKNAVIRSAIITGAGKAFVAGADISEFARLSVDEGKNLAKKRTRYFLKNRKLT